MTSSVNFDDILFSILIGAIPTSSMLIASFALMNLKVPPLVEACFQNFCSGLILAAVAMELFPLMSPSSTTTSFDSVVGTTLGFILGTCTINGMHQLIDSFENEEHEHDGEDVEIPKCEVSCRNYLKQRQIASENQKNEFGSMKSIDLSSKTKVESNTKPIMAGFTDYLPWSSFKRASVPAVEMKKSNQENEKSRICGEVNGKTVCYSLLAPYDISTTPDAEEMDVEKLDLDIDGCEKDGYDSESILYAAIAIATPNHRAHIKEHFVEILNAIVVLENNASTLFLADRSPLEISQAEKLAEAIDEEIHMLQYRLDHTRRLLEGSESDISAAIHKSNPLRNNGENPSWWTAPEKRSKLEGCLGGLKYMAEHLVEHINTNKNITIPILREIHEHIDDMDSQLSTLHKATEDASFIWRRLTRIMGMPAKGSFVPPTLIIPVAIDSFVDGFLIGVASSLSRRAGCILAMANCLEMAFLGMAVSLRVRKCTGNNCLSTTVFSLLLLQLIFLSLFLSMFAAKFLQSQPLIFTPTQLNVSTGSSSFVRLACITVPPFIMMGSTVLGAVVGSVSKGYPILFVGFVAFGVISLLYLVLNELLVEAREAQEGDVRWWVTSVVFFGIYVVIMMDQFTLWFEHELMVY